MFCFTSFLLFCIFFNVNIFQIIENADVVNVNHSPKLLLGN